ncbi:MAG: hypothetical protein ABEH43_03430, partial [Flavobacteriales bacterium]
MGDNASLLIKLNNIFKIRLIKSVFTLFILGLLLIPSKVQASHAMGADITYECLGNDQYVFTLVLYRDCDGITPSSTQTLDFESSSCGTSFSQSLSFVGDTTEVSQLCESEINNSTCNGGTQPGTQQWIYRDT